MIIAESDISLASSSSFSSTRTIQESLRVWTGNSRPDFEGTQQTAVPASTIVTLSEAAQAALADDAQTSSVQTLASIDEAVDNDPRMHLLKLIIEYLTGKKIPDIQTEDIALPAEMPAASSASSSPCF